jgi:crotonobetainyl-CoA:carnitine CoA-transferase CaiB-like acyl-CoA transferase
MIGDCLLENSLTGRLLEPDGNRHPDMSPHGCYPCAGGDWISIAVANDREWQRLCDVLGAAAFAGDPHYGTLAQRRHHADTLDAHLAQLTGSQDAEELAQRLRRAGVSASKSATSVDVISDQQLWDREFYRFVTDHREGQRPILGAAWRMSGASAQIADGAPDLGEDNDYVMHEILGAGSSSEVS